MRRGLKRIIAEVSGMGCSVRLVRCHCDSRTKGNNLVYLVNCHPMISWDWNTSKELRRMKRPRNLTYFETSFGK